MNNLFTLEHGPLAFTPYSGWTKKEDRSDFVQYTPTHFPYYNVPYYNETTGKCWARAPLWASYRHLVATAMWLKLSGINGSIVFIYRDELHKYKLLRGARRVR